MKELLNLFNEVKNKGWIKIENIQKSDSSLGLIFENLIGIKNNSSSKADFKDIEIKTHRNNTNSLLTIFTKNPKWKNENKNIKVNTYLRDKLGSGEVFKVINLTMNINTEYEKNNNIVKFYIKEKEEEIILSVNNQNEIHWSFEDLKTIIKEKINKIALIFGEDKMNDGIYEVKFNEIYFLKNINLEKILNLIKEGKIKIDIRIGTYQSGKNIGKVHDHGSAFRIHIKDLIQTLEVKNVKKL